MKTTQTSKIIKLTLLFALFGAVLITAQAAVQFRGDLTSYAIMNQSFLDGATVTDFTIEFWVKNKRPAIDQQLGGKIEFRKEWVIDFRGGGGIQFFHVWPGAPWPQTDYYYSLTTTNGVLKSNQWQHVAIVGKDTLGSIYVDGTLVYQQYSLRGEISFNAAVFESAVAGFLLGFRDNTTLPDDWPFLGDLADFRIWDIALSEAQIASLYSAAPATNTVGLRHWIPFREGSGSTFTDIIGGLQGQLFNTGWGTDDPQSLFCSPHRATATATVVNGFVVGATITDPGCGYTNAPPVLILGGGGSGATATAVVSDGQVVAINITSAGFGYTDTPQIKIGSPPFEPWVEIGVSRVKVTQHVTLGRNYVLEASPDLGTWTATGPAFLATDETVVSEFVVEETSRYFRLRQVP